MRIVIDLQGAQTQSRYRGIGRYSLALAQAMVRQAKDHEIWIVLNENYPDTIEPIRAIFSSILPSEQILAFKSPLPVSWDDPANIWRIRSAEMIREGFLCRLKPDIVMVMSLFEGATENACLSVRTFETHQQTAVILYDLIPLLDPEDYLGAEGTYKWYMDKIAHIKHSNLLLTISEYTRQVAINNLNIDEKNIVNISTAITDTFRPRLLNEGEKKSLYNHYGISRPYIMYSGAFDGRKNLERLLEAFSILHDDIRKKHDLVFVGKHSEFEQQHIMRLAQHLGVSEQLVLTGYTPDKDLVALYSQCSLFVFPSLHEGFGLPALEAMTCGAPTIGSNTTSIPEVIGLADALFDPTNTQEISDKIASVLMDKSFQLGLRDHGLEQAKKFSWDECAKQAINALESVFVHNPEHEINTWQQQLDEHESNYRKLIDSISRIPIQPYPPTDDDLMSCAVSIAENIKLTDRITRKQELPEQITWRIEGPFDSNYSLALLNRETARVLNSLGHNVVLHSTEGPGDFPPDQKFLRENPDLECMYANSHEIPSEKADITSRNLYPPRVADMRCKTNLLHHYAWEESGFPLEWVDDFNEYLQGITCLSSHVEKIMIDHGVTTPLSVSGCGVDHWERIEPDLNLKEIGRKFKYLHVSSCFPRKGADILLQAYGRAFSIHDDVTLIIKTFPNPHNKIHKLLEEEKNKNTDFPDVVILEDDLNESQLKSLYEQCHALIAPSLAEGFGLPLAEAMLSGLTVITTGWGGQLDFCNEETAWLIDYTFETAHTHFELYDSVWAVPDTKHLTNTIREVYDLPSSLRNKRSLRGRQWLLENFRWSDVASRMVQSARSWAKIPIHQTPRIGWITTWNTRCGIAAYSEHLVRNMTTNIQIFAAKTDTPTQHDNQEVHRCWSTVEHGALEELTTTIENNGIDVVVVQFNYSFFDFDHFSDFLNHQLKIGKIIVITMHSTTDSALTPHKKLETLVGSLKQCHRILVHTPKDMNRLKTLGLIDNVTLFPHGIVDYHATQKSTLTTCYTIASYGYFLPHKGLLELIDAIALLHKDGISVQLRMINAEYPVPESETIIFEAKNKISKYGINKHVKIVTDYLENEESLSLLAGADLIIFPYQNTGESSSAAVRNAITTGRPVAVTPIDIFDDVAPAVTYLPGQSPENLAQGIKKIMQETIDNPEHIKKKTKEADRWRDAHLYSRLGLRLSGMLHALYNSNQKYLGRG